MRRGDFQKLSAEEQQNFYRCPACGEMVEKRELEEIVEHHSHVLHPDWFRISGLRSLHETSH